MKSIEIEIDLDDWNDVELVTELTKRGYNFIDVVDLGEAIEYVESCGYRVEGSSLGVNIVEDLDLEELVSNFLSADFNKREEMLKIK